MLSFPERKSVRTLWTEGEGDYARRELWGSPKGDITTHLTLQNHKGQDSSIMTAPHLAVSFK